MCSIHGSLLFQFYFKFQLQISNSILIPYWIKIPFFFFVFFFFFFFWWALSISNSPCLNVHRACVALGIHVCFPFPLAVECDYSQLYPSIVLHAFVWETFDEKFVCYCSSRARGFVRALRICMMGFSYVLFYCYIILFCNILLYIIIYCKIVLL